MLSVQLVEHLACQDLLCCFITMAVAWGHADQHAGESAGCYTWASKFPVQLCVPAAFCCSLKARPPLFISCSLLFPQKRNWGVWTRQEQAHWVGWRQDVTIRICRAVYKEPLYWHRNLLCM